MPYIALQLVGIQAVLEVTGVGGSGGVIAQDLPLFIAFALLAAYTYSSGLRAPAVIAFVKDALIYLVIIVAVIYIPSKVGGWDHIFAADLAGDIDHSHDDDQVDQGVLDERDNCRGPQTRGVRIGGKEGERDEQRKVLGDDTAGAADTGDLQDRLDADELKCDVGHRGQDAGDGDDQGQPA